MDFDERTLVKEIGTVVINLKKEIDKDRGEMNSLKNQCIDTLEKAEKLVQKDVQSGNLEGIEKKIDGMRDGFLEVIMNHEAETTKRLEELSKQIEALQNKTVGSMVKDTIKDVVKNLSETFTSFKEKVSNSFASMKEAVKGGFDKIKENVKEFKEKSRSDADLFKENMQTVKGFRRELRIFDDDKTLVPYDTKKEIVEDLYNKVLAERIEVAKLEPQTAIGKFLNRHVKDDLAILDLTVSATKGACECLDSLAEGAKTCAKGVANAFVSVKEGIEKAISNVEDFCVETTYKGLSKITEKCEEYLAKENPEVEVEMSDKEDFEKE